MLNVPRRHFLVGSALTPLVVSMESRAAGPADGAVQDQTVQLRSDGLALSPVDYARLLARLAADPGIEADDYSRGGVVGELERRMASVLGKEMAVYLPTGTLANHLAVRMLAGDRRRVLVQQESHLYNDEGDCAQTLSGLTLVPLAPGRAAFTLAEVETEVHRLETARVRVDIGVISIESPVRRVMGELFDFAEMQKIASFARDRRIALHLDGARLFLASAYSGVSPATYAALFDTVYVSLYKYFNSAAGAILAGPRHLMENLYHERRMFGGGMYQAWPDAAVALNYVNGFEDRYARAVATADALFAALERNPRCRVERRPTGTNVARLHVKGARAETLPERLHARGIGILPPQRRSSAGAEFTLFTNESLLRRPAPQLIGEFTEAVG
jgi:threonine aldolase